MLKKPLYLKSRQLNILLRLSGKVSFWGYNLIEESQQEQQEEFLKEELLSEKILCRSSAGDLEISEEVKSFLEIIFTPNKVLDLVRFIPHNGTSEIHLFHTHNKGMLFYSLTDSGEHLFVPVQEKEKVFLLIRDFYPFQEYKEFPEKRFITNSEIINKVQQLALQEKVHLAVKTLTAEGKPLELASDFVKSIYNPDWSGSLALVEFDQKQSVQNAFSTAVLTGGGLAWVIHNDGQNENLKSGELLIECKGESFFIYLENHIHTFFEE